MRIIHFSDFHLESGFIDRSKSIVKNLLDSLKKIHNVRAIDLIIFSGDLIDKAGNGFPMPKMENGFKKFQEIVIEPITTELGLDRNRFLFTLGNHDINRDAESVETNQEIKDKLSNLTAIDSFMDEIYAGNSQVPRIEEFIKFRDNYWKSNQGDAKILITPFQLLIKLEIDNNLVGFNLLNTAWRCYDSSSDKDSILLGKPQITRSKFFFEDCNVTFAVGHHLPFFMNSFESSILEQLIASNYEAFFSGHSHDYDGELITRPQGSCFYFVAPGTLRCNISEEERYKNGFMVIDFDLDGKCIEAQHYFQNINEDFIRDNNYGTYGIWKQAFPGSTILKPMSQSLFRQKKESDFISNEIINDRISQLRDKDNMTMQFVALSGLGKTRIIREAFDDGQTHDNYYYCEFSDMQEGLLYDIEHVLLQHRAEDGLIVLDNCPNYLLNKAIEKRDSYGSRFRIIGVNNDYYDSKSITPPHIKQISLDQDQLRERVNQYVDENIPSQNGDTFARDQIKHIADGFPGMAIFLVKAYQEENSINVHMVDHLVTKLLKFDQGKEDLQETVMRSLALFQPCPYRGQYQEAFSFIRNNEDITPIYGKSENEKRHLFRQTINKYENSLVEVSESWLNVRPFPLAVWLVDKWFRDDDDEERITNIVSAIEALDKPLYGIIKEGLQKRLSYMKDSVPAQDMISRLTNGPKAPFCNEKVVCSDLGSSLFLAMSSVNPGAVAKCLHDVLLSKTSEWVRDHVSGDIRRNLVWALEKLCFSKESYIYGSKVMALLSIAENETWSNNASGQFKQLFHILLPGTEASLEERLDVLRYLKESGQEYLDLLLDCIDRAFDNGNFVRNGSAAQFGLDRKEDYIPSKQEIVSYWETCSDMLQEILDENPSTLERIAKIPVEHMLRWSLDGMLERLFPLLLKISKMKGGVWNELYDVMMKVNKNRISFYPHHFLDILDNFKEEIRPKTFSQKLKDTRYSLFQDHRFSSETFIQHEMEVFNPLAKEFVDKDYYKSYHEIKAIADDKDYLDMWFSLALHDIMTEDQAKCVFNIIYALIVEGGGNDYSSSFVFRFCYVFRKHDSFKELLMAILNKGYKRLFMRLLSHCETEEHDSYELIKSLMNEGKLWPDAPSSYLEYVSVPTVPELAKIVKMFHSDYPDIKVPLMSFMIRHHNRDLLEDSEVLAIVKELALNYPIKGDRGLPTLEYARYVTELLENHHDDDFAAKLNKRIMESMKEQFLFSNFDGIYTELIKDYTDAIWEDFQKAFQTNEFYLFLYQIKDEIGSGSGFGRGPLFQLPDEKVQELCSLNTEYAPHILAGMCPIFHYDSSGNQEIRFSDWVLWLLDKYGDQHNVLDGIHSNMCSFSWTGSIIPILERKRTCLEKIREHKRPQVREWVELCLQEINNDLSVERDRDEFMRLHYN